MHQVFSCEYKVSTVAVTVEGGGGIEHHSASPADWTSLRGNSDTRSFNSVLTRVEKAGSVQEIQNDPLHFLRPPSFSQCKGPAIPGPRAPRWLFRAGWKPTDFL